DEYRNPYSFWISSREKVPFIAGVEIQATMFLNLLRGDWLRRLPYAAEVCIVVLLGAGAGFGLMRLRPGAAIVVALLGLLAVGVSSRELFIGKLVWFPWLVVYAQIVFALICAVAANSVRLYVENKLFVQSLEMYL